MDETPIINQNLGKIEANKTYGAVPVALASFALSSKSV